MSKIKNYLIKLKSTIIQAFWSSVAIFLAATVFVGLATAVYTDQASAAQLTSRYLTVSSSALGNVTTDNEGVAAAAGSGGNGQKAEYTFNFTLATASGNVGSILFEICTTPIAGSTCTSPTGFTAANASAIVAYSGINSGFAVDSSTVLTGAPYNCSGTSPGRTNCIAIKNATPQAIASNLAVSVSFGGGSSNYITNPTTTGTFYTRITTYSSSAYTTQVDYGSVASSTTTEVNISTNVQETLGFSVGTTVTAPGVGCTAFTDGGTMTLGDANSNLSTGTTYYNHSYFRIYTNETAGASVYYSGNTLHQSGGSPVIAAMGTTATASVINSAQFGIAIDTHDTESGSGYSFTNLGATTQYAGDTYTAGAQSGNGTLTGTFAFSTASVTTPVAIATEASAAPITCDTGSVIYLANINTTQSVGVYGTTIDYIAVPDY